MKLIYSHKSHFEHQTVTVEPQNNGLCPLQRGFLSLEVEIDVQYYSIMGTEMSPSVSLERGFFLLVCVCVFCSQSEGGG